MSRGDDVQECAFECAPLGKAPVSSHLYSAVPSELFGTKNYEPAGSSRAQRCGKLEGPQRDPMGGPSQGHGAASEQQRAFSEERQAAPSSKPAVAQRSHLAQSPRTTRRGPEPTSSLGRWEGGLQAGCSCRHHGGGPSLPHKHLLPGQLEGPAQAGPERTQSCLSLHSKPVAWSDLLLLLLLGPGPHPGLPLNPRIPANVRGGPSGLRGGQEGCPHSASCPLRL